MDKTDQEWVVTAKPGEAVDALCQRLEAAGFHVDQALTEIGVLLGHGPADLVPRLRKLKGVAGVEGQVGVDIGPPDAELS